MTSILPKTPALIVNASSTSVRPDNVRCKRASVQTCSVLYYCKRFPSDVKAVVNSMQCTSQHNLEVTHVRPDVSPCIFSFCPILLLSPVAQKLFGRAQQSEVEIRLIVVSGRSSHRITALLARSALDRPV